jgi:hypothetical protein
MRRWFRKKDHEPPTPELDSVSPQAEDSEELPHTQGEENLGLPDNQDSGLLIDAPQSCEDFSEKSDSEKLSPEEGAEIAAPPRGFFRRMFRQDGPLEVEEPAALPEVEEPGALPEAEEPVALLEVEELVSLPEMEAQPTAPEEVPLPTTEELPEPLIVAEEEPIIDLEEVLEDEVQIVL